MHPLKSVWPIWPEQEVKTVRSSSTLDHLEGSAMRTATFDPVVMRQARIGRSLRQVYDGVTECPLPDQFGSLLDALDQIELPATKR